MCYLLLKLSLLDSYYSKSPKTFHREVGQGQALTMSRSPQTSWKISAVGTKWGQSGTRGCRRPSPGTSCLYVITFLHLHSTLNLAGVGTPRPRVCDHPEATSLRGPELSG